MLVSLRMTLKLEIIITNMLLRYTKYCLLKNFMPSVDFIVKLFFFLCPGRQVNLSVLFSLVGIWFNDVINFRRSCIDKSKMANFIVKYEQLRIHIIEYTIILNGSSEEGVSLKSRTRKSFASLDIQYFHSIYRHWTLIYYESTSIYT